MFLSLAAIRVMKRVGFCTARADRSQAAGRDFRTVIIGRSGEKLKPARGESETAQGSGETEFAGHGLQRGDDIAYVVVQFEVE